jgi:membrane protein implicated in regulation of membrane protease activity
MPLQPILDFLLAHAPAPGVLTLVLAVVAAVVSTPMVVDRIKGSWWGHAVLFVILGSIASLEIMVINHADMVSEERITKLQRNVQTSVDKTTEVQTTLNGYIKSETITTQVRIERQQHHKGYDDLLELKARAANLSSNIFSVLVNRAMARPAMNATDLPTFHQETQLLMAFEEQTVLMYLQKYGADAQRLVDDLEKHGLKDDILRRFVANPTNTIGVRIVASHLASQAERITSEGIKPLDKNFF